MRCNVSQVLFLQKRKKSPEGFGEIQIEGQFAKLAWILKNVSVLKDWRSWDCSRFSEMTINAMGNPSPKPEYLKRFFKLDTWGSVITGSIAHGSIVPIQCFLNVIIIMWLWRRISFSLGDAR